MYGCGGQLGHVTSIMSSDFHFLVPFLGNVVSERIRFEYLYVHNLGLRSSNDLDLQYSHTFIYSIRCLLLPHFRSLAAIISEKSTVFAFPIKKPMLPNLTLP